MRTSGRAKRGTSRGRPGRIAVSSGRPDWGEAERITGRSRAEARVAPGVGPRQGRTAGRSGRLPTRSSQVVGSPGLVLLVLQGGGRPGAGAQVGRWPLSFAAPVAVVVSVHLNVPGSVLVPADIHNEVAVAFVAAVAFVSGFTQFRLKLELLRCNLIVWG